METKEKIRIAAYVDAKHNMRTDEINTAVEQQQRAVDNAKTQHEHAVAVLAGLKQAQKERGGKKASA